MLNDGTLEAHEVKGGFWEDKARTKIKIAAEMYPFRFMAAKQRAKKLGGGWQYEVFGDVSRVPEASQGNAEAS